MFQRIHGRRVISMQSDAWQTDALARGRAAQPNVPHSLSRGPNLQCATSGIHREVVLVKFGFYLAVISRAAEIPELHADGMEITKYADARGVGKEKREFWKKVPKVQPNRMYVDRLLALSAPKPISDGVHRHAADTRESRELEIGVRPIGKSFWDSSIGRTLLSSSRSSTHDRGLAIKTVQCRIALNCILHRAFRSIKIIHVYLYD